MNKKKLLLSRKKIDQLDSQIFNLLRKRTNVVKYMLTLKQYKHQIVDKKRIKEILINIRKKSRKQGIDPKITISIWKKMIWTFVNFQRRNFKKK